MLNFGTELRGRNNNIMISEILDLLNLLSRAHIEVTNVSQ